MPAEPPRPPQDPDTPATMAFSELSDDEHRRYSRHTLLPEVGEAGQRRLREAAVLLVGAGGLGSPAALYLAAAGVGRLGIIDDDRVDLSNLQRQVLHDTHAVGAPKVASARARLEALNPHVRVETIPARLTRENALELVARHDVVLDGADNLATRYLINDACVLTGRPWVHGSVLRFEGQVAVFATPDGPCYRCLFPEPPPPETVPGCGEAGVLGVLPGIIGTLQATETLKLLLGIGEPLAGRLLLLEALGMQVRTIRVPRDPACPACGTRTITALGDYDALCAGPAAGAGAGVEELEPRALDALLRGPTPPRLVDVRERWEWELARIEGATLMPLSRFAGESETLAPGRWNCSTT